MFSKVPTWLDILGLIFGIIASVVTVLAWLFPNPWGSFTWRTFGIAGAVALYGVMVHMISANSRSSPISTWRRWLGIALCMLVPALALGIGTQFPSTTVVAFQQSDFSETLFPWHELSNERRTQECRDNNMSVSSVQTNTSPNNPAGITTVMSVVPKTNYQFRAWLKFDRASRVHLSLVWYTLNNTRIDNHIGQDLVPSSEGTVYVESVTAPANATSVLLFIVHGVDNTGNPVPNSEICIDDVILEPTP